MGHFFVFILIIEEQGCFLHDPFCRCAHQLGSACHYALNGPPFPHDQDRLAQGWRFLLDTAGIGDYEVRFLPEIYK